MLCRIFIFSRANRNFLCFFFIKKSLTSTKTPHKVRRPKSRLAPIVETAWQFSIQFRLYRIRRQFLENSFSKYFNLFVKKESFGFKRFGFYEFTMRVFVFELPKVTRNWNQIYGLFWLHEKNVIQQNFCCAAKIVNIKNKIRKESDFTFTFEFNWIRCRGIEEFCSHSQKENWFE